jgi:SAM-dependent methyltransferase
VTPTVAPLEEHTDRYEEWFEHHPAVHESELAAIRRVLTTPGADGAVEVGVGSGQFPAPLGVGLGVDPSPAVLDRARRRGILRRTDRDVVVADSLVRDENDYFGGGF